MAAIPGYHQATYAGPTIAATPNTVQVKVSNENCDATPWSFKKPPTLKERKEQTMKYFKSFGKKKR